MSFLRQFIQKSFPKAIKSEHILLRTSAPGSSWYGTEEPTGAQINEIIAEINNLLFKYPGTPDFLGKKLEYPKKRRFILFRINRKPNLSGLREEVNKFMESTKILEPRKKIIKLLKKYPYDPDLRALSAIQVFNDSSQSGLDEKKLDVLCDSVSEIAGAIHNGGMSIFNVTWFIKIYLRYLDLLKDKFTHEYNSYHQNRFIEVRNSAENLSRAVLQLTSLMSVKDKLDGLIMLNAKLKGSVYILNSITKDEIRSACTATMQNDLTRLISPGKTANYVILVIMTLSLLFARIPILKRLVSDILTTIPDISKDLILQKSMVNSMMNVTDFQLALSSGDIARSRDVADRLYLRCKSVINQHLEYSILTKPHEVDPFLKAGWIAKESNGLFKESDYRVRLEEANKFLTMITGNRGKVRGAFELARQLQNDIDYIKSEYGWSL